MFKSVGKLMKGQLISRVIDTAAIVGISAWAGSHTAQDYTPGMSHEGIDLNSRSQAEAQAKPQAKPDVPKAALSPKARDLAAKIQEERAELAAKRAAADVKDARAKQRLDEMLNPPKKDPGFFSRMASLFSSDPKPALGAKTSDQAEIARRKAEYMNPNSELSLSATAPRKEPGSFWGGAATAAIGVIAAGLLVKRFWGRRPSQFIHGPVPGVSEYNAGVLKTHTDDLAKKVTAGNLPPEQLAELRAQYTQSVVAHSVDVGHTWFPTRKGLVLDKAGQPLPHATPYGRGEVAVNNFNAQAAAPAGATAPHAQPSPTGAVPPSTPQTPPTAAVPPHAQPATAHDVSTPPEVKPVNYDIPAVMRRGAATPTGVVDTSMLPPLFEDVAEAGKPLRKPFPSLKS